MEDVQITKAKHCPILALEQTKAKAREIHKAHVPDEQISIPNPEYRQVAGVVTRRTDPVQTPVPAPNNRSPASTARKVRSNGIKRRRIGFGSDSDTDHDDDRRDGTKANSVCSNPKKQPIKVDEFGDAFLMRLKIEEEERVRQLRELKEIGDKWDDIRFEHDFNQEKGKVMGEILLRARNKYFQGPEIHDGILDRNSNRENYLEEVLYGAIKDTARNNGAVELTIMESIVQRVEGGVLNRCYTFDQWKFGKLTQTERLSSSLRDAEKLCWRSRLFNLALQAKSRLPESVPAQPFLQNNSDSPSSISSAYGEGSTNQQEGSRDARWREELAFAVRTFMAHHCPRPTILGKRSFINVLEDSFWGKIVTRMCDVAVSAEAPYDPDGTWLECFDKSREDGHMTQSYIDWVISGVDAAELEKLCSQWHRVKRYEAIRQYRQSMQTVKIDVEQVFCSQVGRAHEVCLLLVKGGYPTSLRTIPTDELVALGWYRECKAGDLMFWRCETVGQNESRGHTDILKVDMNGKVLGAFCLCQYEWVLLEIDDGNTGAHPWKIRKLNDVERSVLCKDGLAPNCTGTNSG